jgi:HSP20 family protein
MVLGSAAVHDLDRLTARVFCTATRSSGCRLDAYRDRDEFFIDIDLPGVDPASIDVTVDHKILTVRAERKHGLQVVGAEKPDTVTRQIPLADTLVTDLLDASYDGGVLTLRIPIDEPDEAQELPPAA